jgi:hypothetical protein
MEEVSSVVQAPASQTSPVWQSAASSQVPLGMMHAPLTQTSWGAQPMAFTQVVVARTQTPFSQAFL